MGYTNKIAIVEGQEVFVAAESVAGTLKFPAATDLVVAAGDGSLNQNPTFTDSDEISDSRSVLATFQDRIPAGTFSIPTYARPSGAAGSVPSADALLEAAFGTKAVVASTSVTYSLAKLLSAVSIWIKKDHTVFFARGATVSELSQQVSAKGAMSLDFSGAFMEMGWCGTDQLDGAITGATTATDTITVNDAKKYTVGGRIQIGSDDNSGAGYEITAVNTTTEILTVSPDVNTDQDDAATVAPFLPTGSAVGSPMENRKVSVTVAGVAAKLRNFSLTKSEGIGYIEDEVSTDDYPSDYAEGKRKVSGKLGLYFRTDDLKYFYDALQGTLQAIVVTADNGAGNIITETLGHCRLTVPTVTSAAPTVALDIDFTAQASSGEDEMTLAFT